MNSNVNINNRIKNDKYNQLNLLDAYIDTFASSIEFYSRLNSAFIDAVSVPFTDAREEIREIRNEIRPAEFFYYNLQQQQELYRKMEKIIFSKIRDKFDANFREKTFVDSLSEFVESYCNLANITGIGFLYQKITNLNSFWNNVFIEPIRSTWGRTSSHKIKLDDKYSLMHYDLHQQEEKEEEKISQNSENNTIKQRSKIITKKANEDEIF